MGERKRQSPSISRGALSGQNEGRSILGLVCMRAEPCRSGFHIDLQGIEFVIENWMIVLSACVYGKCDFSENE